MSDEEVVTPDGGLCTVKDCCVVICEEAKFVGNPGRGAFTDRDAITKAFDAVGRAVEQGHGLWDATRVTETLYALPIVYNARLTRAVGRAKFASFLGMPMPTTIELSGAIEIPPDYMHRLLVHEGCHVARALIAKGQFNYENPHGPAWQALMVMAGEEPKATCSDPRLMESGRVRQGGPQVALTIADFQVGDRVSFAIRKQRVIAEIIQKTPKGAIVRNDQGDRWKVGYGLLTKEGA